MSAANRRDAIVVGGGHNGLVTACYLARAGLSVLVLERRYLVGGACVTEETFPGFKVSTAAYVNSLFRKEIVRDLRLAEYGFEVLPRNPSSFTPYPDGRSLLLGPDPALNHAGDREVQRARRGALPRVRGHARARRRASSSRRSTMTPPDLLRPGAPRAPAAPRARAVVPAARAGGVARPSRCSPAPPAPSSTAGSSRPSSSPRWPPTPSSAPWRARRCPAPPTCCSITSWARPTAGAACGATCAAAWAASPRRSPRAAREPRRGDPVRRRGGPHPRARRPRRPAWPWRAATSTARPIVASNADAHVTFTRLARSARAARRSSWPPSSGSATRAPRSRSTWPSPSCPSFRACPGTEPGPQHRGTIHICPDLDYIERAYDDAKYGRPSARPVLECTIPSVVDPTVAPPGRHLMSIFVQYAPYALREGDLGSAPRALRRPVLRRCSTSTRRTSAARCSRARC